MPISVGYIIGSLSSQSINRQVVDGLVSIERENLSVDAAHRLTFTEIPISDLPLYNYDYDESLPPQVVELKDAIRSSDALLIATPEYNRSIPGALKNALDWGSRPYGDSAFGGKPVGIVGASVGAPGTSMAQQHLRNILAYLDAPTLGQPEVFLQFDAEWFGSDGTVVNTSVRGFLADWLTAYRGWVMRFASRPVSTAG